MDGSHLESPHCPGAIIARVIMHANRTTTIGTAWASKVNVRDHRLAVANTSQVDVRDHRTPSPPVSVALRAGYRSTTVQRRSPQRLSTTPFRLQVDGWARGPAHNANLGGVGIQIAAQIGYGYVGTEVAAADYANVSFAQAGGVVGLIVPLSARVSIGGELAAGARSGPLGDRYFDTRAKAEVALVPMVAIGASAGVGWQADRESYGALYLALSSR